MSLNSLTNFFNLNILPESQQLDYLLYGIIHVPVAQVSTSEPIGVRVLVPVYKCPSYIDDDGVLQNCKCGGGCNE